MHSRKWYEFSHDNFNKNLFECGVCKKSFSQEDLLNEHYISHCIKNHECMICDEKCTDKNSLARHYQRHTKILPVAFSVKNESIANENGGKEELFTCEVCRKSFESKNDHDQHVIIHSTLKTEDCHMNQKSYDGGRKSRVNVFKKSEVPWTRLPMYQKKHANICYICHQSFQDGMDLNLHYLLHAAAKPFKCDMCIEAFDHAKEFETHYHIHIDDKPYECEICGRYFSEMDILRAHVAAHSDGEKYVCEICNEGYKDENDLKQHFLGHKNEYPYACNTCGRCFSEQRSLYRHSLVHTKGKPYECEFCNAGYDGIKNFVRHCRIHLVKRAAWKSLCKDLSYFCAVCDKGFWLKEEHETHSLEHEKTWNNISRKSNCSWK